MHAPNYQIGWQCVWLPISCAVPMSLIGDEHQLLALHIIDTCLLYGIARCPLLRWLKCIEVTIQTFRIVRYNAGIHRWRVSVKWDFTVGRVFLHRLVMHCCVHFGHRLSHEGFAYSAIVNPEETYRIVHNFLGWSLLFPGFNFCGHVHSHTLYTVQSSLFCRFNFADRRKLWNLDPRNFLLYGKSRLAWMYADL